MGLAPTSYFYCPSIRLCIELDGEVHNTAEQQEKDADRTTFLNQNRIHVLRLKNEEVETDIQRTLDKIKDYINGLGVALVQTPNPLT